MKGAFVHDHYFVYNAANNKYYDGSGGVFTQSLWNRYLAVFENLVVIGREKKSLPNKLVLSSSENVDFVLISNLKSSIDRFVKAQAVKDRLKITLEHVDFAIIRVPSVLGYLAQSVCKELRKPYVLEVVGCPWDAYWNYGGLKAKLMAPLEMWKLKSVTKSSKACIYVTKTFLQSRYPTRGISESISNVNLGDTIETSVAIKFYEEYLKEPSKSIFKIGLIGSFHIQYKGHIEALKALQILVMEYGIKNMKLYLVGTGDSTWIVDNIEKFGLDEFVEVVGTLPAGDGGVIPFLDSMHLYIHPSKQEGLPRVVIEAMSRGRLTLASSVAGTPELLDRNFLHEPGDYKKLSNDIFAIYTDHSGWKSIITANVDISSSYTEKKLQQKRVDFITETYNLWQH